MTTSPSTVPTSPEFVSPARYEIRQVFSNGRILLGNDFIYDPEREDAPKEVRPANEWDFYPMATQFLQPFGIEKFLEDLGVGPACWPAEEIKEISKLVRRFDMYPFYLGKLPGLEVGSEKYEKFSARLQELDALFFGFLAKTGAKDPAAVLAALKQKWSAAAAKQA